MRLLACLFVLLAAQLQAAVVYVDNAATGANDGTSWTDAWTNFDQIVWSGCSLNSTLYISGGTVSKTYTNTLCVSRSTNVTITVGTDAGHSGLVILDGLSQLTNGVTLSNSVKQLWLDGGPNTNILLCNWVNYGTSLRDGNGIGGTGLSASGLSSNAFSRLNISNCNQGINFLAGATPGTVSNCLIQGIRGGCGIAFLGSLGTYDSVVIHDNTLALNTQSTMDGWGPDGIQAQHGLSLYNNFIYSVATTNVNPNPTGQHQDGAQPTGDYCKIFDNRFIGMGNSGVHANTYTATTMHDYQIYNNLIVSTNPTGASEYQSGIQFEVYNVTSNYYNVLIANNTIADFFKMHGLFVRFWTNCSLTNVIIENNIVMNSGLSHALWVTTNYAGLTVDLSGMTLDYNAVNAGASGLGDVYVMGADYAQTHPRTNAPTFSSYTERTYGNDFHLSDADTATKHLGTDLSAYFTTGLDGRIRTIPWSIGCYQNIPYYWPQRIGGWIGP